MRRETDNNISLLPSTVGKASVPLHNIACKFRDRVKNKKKPKVYLRLLSIVIL